MVRRTRARVMPVVGALLLASCGVDRLDPDETRVLMLLALDEEPAGTGGGAVRDERGIFRLEATGIYVSIEVDAPDLEEPVHADWPPARPGAIPSTVEIPVTVKAGSDRTFRALVLLLGESTGLAVHAGQTLAENLPGGTEVELEMTLEPVVTVPVTGTIAVPGGIDVLEVHPVDVERQVMYPAAAFTRDGDVIEATASALPVGRSVSWTMLTPDAEWVDAPGVTEVTP